MTADERHQGERQLSCATRRAPSCTTPRAELSSGPWNRAEDRDPVHRLFIMWCDPWGGCGAGRRWAETGRKLYLSLMEPGEAFQADQVRKSIVGRRNSLGKDTEACWGTTCCWTQGGLSALGRSPRAHFWKGIPWLLFLPRLTQMIN